MSSSSRSETFAFPEPAPFPPSPAKGSEPFLHDAGRHNPLAGRKMLFIAPDDYPPFRVDLVELFSRHLVSRGLKIDWSLRRVDEGEGGVDDRGAERFFLPRRQPGKRFSRAFHAVAFATGRFKLAWQAARGEYDIVQVRDDAFWAVPFLIAAKLSRRPFVFWMSYPILEGRLKLAIRPLQPTGYFSRALRAVYALVGMAVLYRVVLPLSAHVVVQSKRMRERVAEHGVAFDHMTPVPMGASTERYNPETIAPVDDPRLDGRKTIVHLCADICGIPSRVAIEALAHTVAKGHDALLVNVGSVSPFEREEMKKLEAGLGISGRIVLTGRLPLPKALSYVRRADVCISPFEMNPEQEVATPTKLVEYLAMGRPVVASIHYDQNEVLSSSGAGITTDFTGEAMAEGIDRLLSDPIRANAMGAKGASWVRANRDYARLAGVVEQLYGSLLNEAGVRTLKLGSKRV